jgi:hypothetical protein
MKTAMILFAVSSIAWADYRQVLGKDGNPRFDIIQRIEDTAFIPNDPKNRDWREYQDWLTKGNLLKSAIVPTITDPSKDLTDAKDTKKLTDQRLDALIKVLGL